MSGQKNCMNGNYPIFLRSKLRILNCLETIIRTKKPKTLFYFRVIEDEIRF